MNNEYYIQEDGPFLEWLKKHRAYGVLDVRKSRTGGWEVQLLRRGSFGPQWRPLPPHLHYVIKKDSSVKPKRREA